MKNIHLIPTDNKPSRLYFNVNDKEFQICEVEKTSTILKPNRHIYITNDEEIKEVDWCYNSINNTVYQKKLDKISFAYEYKIILTTDQDLIKDGVQAIDDEFLEWFVKNPSCEGVEVIYGLYNLMGRKVSSEKVSENHSQCVWKYKIIIPKEEDKKKHIVMIVGDKVNEEPKQETLEEAAEKYANKNFSTKDPVADEGWYGSWLGFRNGAKWQIGKQDNFIIGFLEFIEGTYSYSNIFDYWYLHADTSKTYTKKELLKKYIDTLNGN